MCGNVHCINLKFGFGGELDAGEKICGCCNFNDKLCQAGTTQVQGLRDLAAFVVFSATDTGRIAIYCVVFFLGMGVISAGGILSQRASWQLAVLVRIESLKKILALWF